MASKKALQNDIYFYGNTKAMAIYFYKPNAFWLKKNDEGAAVFRFGQAKPSSISGLALWVSHLIIALSWQAEYTFQDLEILWLWSRFGVAVAAWATNCRVYKPCL